MDSAAKNSPGFKLTNFSIAALINKDSEDEAERRRKLIESAPLLGKSSICIFPTANSKNIFLLPARLAQNVSEQNPNFQAAALSAAAAAAAASSSTSTASPNPFLQHQLQQQLAAAVAAQQQQQFLASTKPPPVSSSSSSLPPPPPLTSATSTPKRFDQPKTTSNNGLDIDVEQCSDNESNHSLESPRNQINGKKAENGGSSNNSNKPRYSSALQLL